jgi:hypothetical protein
MIDMKDLTLVEVADVRHAASAGPPWQTLSSAAGPRLVRASNSLCRLAVFRILPLRRTRA